MLLPATPAVDALCKAMLVSGIRWCLDQGKIDLMSPTVREFLTLFASWIKPSSFFSAFEQSMSLKTLQEILSVFTCNFFFYVDWKDV